VQGSGRTLGAPNCVDHEIGSCAATRQRIGVPAPLPASVQVVTPGTVLFGSAMGLLTILKKIKEKEKELRLLIL